MTEVTLSFGAERHLVGTLCRPGDAAVGDCAVLLLNAGVIHRIGPHRFNVKLARALARAGLPSLRLDLSGQGDSRLPAQPLPYPQQAVADLRAAMDHLQGLLGVQRFVIAGICSGANHGLAAADADPRVAGLWMLDTHLYPTPRTRRERWRLQWRLRGPALLLQWARAAGSALRQRLRAPAAPGGAAPPAVDYGANTPDRASFAALLNRLTGRGVRIHMIYTGSMLWSYNYPDQLKDAFRGEAFLDRLRCEFLPEVDHTATLLASQQRLIASLCQWVGEARA